MTVRAEDDEVVDAEFVEDGELVRAAPAPRPLVDEHTVLRPGESIPTSDDPGTTYTERDLYVSEETARILDESDPGDSGPMKAFKAWCAEQGRVAVPCTTATFTEYSRHLMQRGLKVATIKNYMSRIRTAMPAGKKPDNSLYLRLLADYRKKNKRAVRTRQAFPLTLSYVVPMMEKAEADGRPIGIRDAAMFAFGYMFLGRSIEDVNLEIEDVKVLDDRVLVWLAEDKTHKDEEQTIPLKDRPEDVQLVRRMRRWLDYLASMGVTTGPVFRHLLKNGMPATEETRAKTATKRGLHLRGHVVNERVKHWFAKAGLVGDGRPITSHGLRAGAATDLAANDATDEDLERAGRWAKGSSIPRKVYVRPAQDAKKNPFDKVPVHDPTAPA
ncbi:tyrosine-type recombinase/integrase [Streptomyces griseomycini]|uniref:Integrase n=1 Tax=Streptomyces griseomycini TaxID=66895 RepID=A0A7W7PWF9_9ACTN|nr:tyrosine-type recombinase/integrase [Streptomyces griseomycini]MBB4902539.1 integrase [Streptomyces griseomycini]GGR52292.1 integrase [Streptomyces griseomycini]